MKHVALIAQIEAETTNALTQSRQWWQLGAIALALITALLLSVWLDRRIAAQDSGIASSFGYFVRDAIRRVLFPVFVCILALLAFSILELAELPNGVLHFAVILSLSLAVVRLLVYAIRRTLRPGPILAALERVIAWLIWVWVALYLLGWLGDVAAALDAVVLPIGGKRLSLLDAGRMLVTLLFFMLVAVYVGTLIERRIMAAGQISIGIRVGVVKFTRFFLVLLAGLIALETLGISFTTLTVFGGAIGVGIGFGLQRIASNLISGFILVVDRSIRQGDVITIGARFGVVRELRARYVVVRDRDGVDTLIPNETLITSEVVNWSYGDRLVRLKLPVDISYSDDPRKAMQILTAAAGAHARVEKKPAPAARIIEFGDNGIKLELRFWIDDPEEGVVNVRSDLYLTIWDEFTAAGITFPFPQRDLNLRTGWPQTAPADLPRPSAQ